MRTHQTVWALALALLAAGACGDDRARDDGTAPQDPRAMAAPDTERDTHGERGMGANRDVPRTGAIDKNDDDEPVGHP